MNINKSFIIKFTKNNLINSMLVLNSLYDLISSKYRKNEVSDNISVFIYISYDVMAIDIEKIKYIFKNNNYMNFHFYESTGDINNDVNVLENWNTKNGYLFLGDNVLFLDYSNNKINEIKFIHKLTFTNRLKLLFFTLTNPTKTNFYKFILSSHQKNFIQLHKKKNIIQFNKYFAIFTNDKINLSNPDNFKSLPPELFRPKFDNIISLKKKVKDFDIDRIFKDHYIVNRKTWVGDKVIFFVIDKNYIDNIEIALTTTSHFNPDIDIFILHNDIGEYNMKKLKSFYHSVNFMNIKDEPIFDNIQSHTRHGKMVAAKMLFNLLDYKQILYLDSDIYTNSSLESIFKLRDKAFYFAKDSIEFSELFSRKNNHDKKRAIHNSFNSAYSVDYIEYWNSGVFLINNDKINKSYNIIDSFDNWMKYYPESSWPDQDFLNIYIKSHYTYGTMENIYNAQNVMMGDFENASIYHFIGPEKLFNFDKWKTNKHVKIAKAEELLENYKDIKNSKS